MVISSKEFKSLVTKGQHPKATLRKDIGGQPVTDLSDRVLRFVVSTSAVDRDGDTIDQSGWDLTAYRNNPVVLWGHDQSSMPVGKAVSIDVVDNQLVASVQFVSEDVPVAGPIAEAVYQLCRGGFLCATSVGFSPIDYDLTDDPDRAGSYPGLDHKRQALLEFSIVTVPSNYEALLLPDSIPDADTPDDVAVVAPETVIAAFNSAINKAKRGRALYLASIS